jgi:hypothetical protein
MRKARMIVALASAGVFVATAAMSGERLPKKAQPLVGESTSAAFANFPTITRSKVAAASQLSDGFDVKEKSWIANYPPNNLLPR